MSSPFPIPVVADRLNAAGSHLFKAQLLSRDVDGILALARAQLAAGAGSLDVCTALDDGPANEQVRLTWVTTLLARELRTPLVVDSAEPSILAGAAELGPGTVLNSISLKHGATGPATVLEAARRHGLTVVALTIDAEGLATTVERRMQVTTDLLSLARACDVATSSLWCDPLVVPIASHPAAARTTIESIREMTRAWPRLTTVAGISDISFGLPPAARAVVDRVFLRRCAEAGLGVALANPSRLRRDTLVEDERLADAAVMNGDAQALETLAARHRA